MTDDRNEFENMISDCFLNFSEDPIHNINIMTAYLGETLDAAYALYNYMNRGLLCSLGRWQTPPDFNPQDEPQGYICFDVITNGSGMVKLIRDLDTTAYMNTDPNVKKYKLKTYIGIGITVDGKTVGSLCAVFVEDFEPTSEDLQLLRLLAEAIGVEEKRRAARESLEASEAKYRAFIEQTAENIFLIEPSTGKIVEGNAALRNLLGYSVDEMEDIAVFDFVAHTREDIFEKIQNIMKTGRLLLGERQYRRKDGTIVDVEVSAGVVRFHEKMLISVVSRDIGDQKRLLSALRDREHRLSSIYNNASVGIVFVDRNGHFLDFNDTLKGMIGYDESELLSKDIQSLTRQTGNTLFPVKPSSGTVEYRTEQCFVRGTGEIFWGDTSITLLSGENEEHIGYICVIVDISDRHRAEEALRISEIKYRSLAENLNVGVYRNTIGSEGKFIEANPAIVDMFGFDKKEDFLRTPVADLYQNPEDRRLVNQKLLEEGSLHDEELYLLRKDGTGFVASISAVAVPGDDGSVAFFDGIIEDISERKRVEEELRRSEHQYRTTLDSMGDAIHVIDRDLRILLINRRFQEWNKSLNLDAEVIGKSLFDVFPFLTDDIKNEYETVFTEDRTLVTEESNIIGSDEIVTETRKIPVKEGDRVVRIVTVVRDVSEQKHAVMALKESEERYRELFDRAADLVYTLDLRGTFTQVNKAAFKHTGSTVDDLLGINFLEFLSRSDRKTAIRAFKGVYRDRNYIQGLPIAVRVKDGSLRKFEISVGPLIRDGRVVGFLGSARDITERLHAEEALRQSEERFRTMTDLLPEVVFETDTSGNLTYVNRRGFALSGYTEKDFRRGINAVDLVIPEDRDRIRKNMKRILAGELTRDTEYTGLNKNGSHFPILSRATRIVRNGSVHGLRGVIIDMTERHGLEEQLRHAAKMEAIGQLAGGIAHDFNNLLTGIVGYSSMLKLKYPQDSFGFEAGKTIERAAERATDLTKQLLGFARRGKNQIVTVDVHKTIYDVVTLLSRTIDKNIRISLELTASPATTSGDPGQIQQMLLNLAINARDAMPAGGDLRFSTELIDVRDDALGILPKLKLGRYVRIGISDTGTGISSEVKDRIFEPFFTTKPKGEGTGMGLAMVYGIVQNHGGDIRLESELEKGTIFNVYLPLTESELPEITEETDQESLHGSGTILIVDDEEVVRDTSSAMLSELGYTVYSARNGTEALAVLQERHDEIDLVIVDLIMPDMGGRECFRKLKDLDPHVKVILSTGYSTNGKVQETLDEGILGFIQKPYTMNHIATVIKKALSS